MRATTLFDAYRICIARKTWAVDCRGSSEQGIAVRDDKWALEWQRYNRLEFKLAKRLRDILVQVDKEKYDEGNYTLRGVRQVRRAQGGNSGT